MSCGDTKIDTVSTHSEPYEYTSSQHITQYAHRKHHFNTVCSHVLGVKIAVKQPVDCGHILREECTHVGVGGLRRQLQVLQVALHCGLGRQGREAGLNEGATIVQLLTFHLK